jgi:D-arginine dehydrogenase
MGALEVCIIGGGMAGASVAYHLAPHARVTLLEREPQPGYHSSGRSAALFAPNYGSALVQRLALAGQPFMRAPPEGFAGAPLLRERGFMLIGDGQQLAEREAYEATARSSGLPVERLSPAQARTRLPALRADACEWALYDESAWDIDVDALLQGFLRGARAHGARVLAAREVSALGRDGGTWRVRTAEFECHADVVVNAAGAWADGIAALAGVAPLGLVPHRRTAFIFDPPPGVEVARWPMVADASERFYFKPDAARLLGSLADEVPVPPHDVQPEDLDVATAVDRIEQVLEFEIRRVARAWAGLRTFAPDRDAVSGFEPSAPGFYWHAGVGGFGIESSPALGAFAAASILEQSLPPTFETHAIRAAQLAPSRLRGATQQYTATGDGRS